MCQLSSLGQNTIESIASGAMELLLAGNKQQGMEEASPDVWFGWRDLSSSSLK